MSNKEFEYMTDLERFHYFKGEGCDSMAAALLVLSAAVREGG
jgi:hypothetical protein